MAVGELKWSSKGKTVAKFDTKPLPPDEYDFQLSASAMEIKKGDKPGKVPYITVTLDALGTATSEGGKNRKVFHNIFLHLTPSEKDGKAMVDRGGGLLDLAKSVGQDCEFSALKVKYAQYDPKGNMKGELKDFSIAKPQEVLEWLKSLDGMTVRGRTKIEKSPGYNDKTVIEYFIPSEDAGSENEEEFDELDSEEAEEEVEEDVEEPAEENADVEEESDELEEEEPEEEEVEEDVSTAFNPKAKAAAAAAKAKTASKVVQGPTKKGGKLKSKK